MSGGSGDPIAFVYTDVDPNPNAGTNVDAVSADGEIVAGDIFGGNYFFPSVIYGSFVENLATGVVTDISDANGSGASVVALSADGGIVAGNYTNFSGVGAAFVENVATGVTTEVADPLGAMGTSVIGMSDDGALVVGDYVSASGYEYGFVETVATGQFAAVVDPNGNNALPAAISGDGQFVVGRYLNSSGAFNGFVQNLATGADTVVSDPNADGDNTIVTAITADGGMVAGWYDSASGDTVGFVENLATGVYTDVSDPNAGSINNAGTLTEVEHISADGSTVAGEYYNSGAEEQGFVETLATGVYTDIVDPNQNTSPTVEGSSVQAIDANGATVVGAYSNAASNQWVGYVATAPCYVRGASILTERGEVAVERLVVGDRVVTASGGSRPVVWLGRRRLDLTRHPAPEKVWPVRMSAGAFGEGAPHRDLWLSPGHNIARDGVLIPAAALVNGASVAQIKTATVEYWHVELDAHDIMLAEGLPAESYLDTGNRTGFENGGAFIEAHPDFAPKHWAETCLPLVNQGGQLDRARAHLRARLPLLGFAVTTEADPHLLADGRRVEPLRLDTRRLAFLPPPESRSILLRSRSFLPAYSSLANADMRELGVSVARLQIDGVDVALDDPRLDRGWQDCEREDSRPARRWTNGAATLPERARRVVIDLAGDGLYWHKPGDRAAGSAIGASA
jgi:uncharacterized membrane protein